MYSAIVNITNAANELTEEIQSSWTPSPIISLIFGIITVALTLVGIYLAHQYHRNRHHTMDVESAAIASPAPGNITHRQQRNSDDGEEGRGRDNEEGTPSPQTNHANPSHAFSLDASEHSNLNSTDASEHSNSISVHHEPDRTSNTAVPGTSMAKLSESSNMTVTERIDPEPLHRSLSGSTLVSCQERDTTAETASTA